mgnify:CR=1 FL=1
MEFPEERPPKACFIHPEPDRDSELNPPGFSWHRAAPPGECRYRLKMSNASGEEMYISPPESDPVHLPDRTFRPGEYTWYVEALDGNGDVRATTEERGFRIAEDSLDQPWINPRDLLAEVPEAYPRLLFPAARLDDIRDSLDTTRSEAFANLRDLADGKLDLEPIPEPTYHLMDDGPERRMAYMETFQTTRQIHDRGMRMLALMYVLSGEKKYGEKAKELLLDVTGWDVEGVSSVRWEPYGDEVGLGLAKSGAPTFDWIQDLLDEDERERVRQMLHARADQMLGYLKEMDYIAYPERSHLGRIVGYLLEHAIVLKDAPRAEAWAEHSMRILTTFYPHWGGRDGGWSQGISYGTAYALINLMPFAGWSMATGFDIWQRPFFRRFPYFILYNVSPRGEIMPFGDSEHFPLKANSVRSLIQFHALNYRDPILRSWVEFLRRGPEGDEAELAPLPGLILPDDLEPGDLSDLPPDRTFQGVGRAALHSRIGDPEKDLLVLFRSSPFGGVSHSHANQNAFCILKGGRALAAPGGLRWPTHGSPFHAEYAQQSHAHNTLLVDGEGQIYGGGSYNGRIGDFRSQEHHGYVRGDAGAAYGKRLTRFQRHLVLIRPNVVVLLDDIAAPETRRYQWLLHALEHMDVDEEAGTVLVRRNGARMRVHLASTAQMALEQTNEWPVAPHKGFPDVDEPRPEKRWHLTGTIASPMTNCRIGAIMTVAGPGEALPEWGRRQTEDNMLEASLRSTTGELSLCLSLNPASDASLIESNYRSEDGQEESLIVTPE